jgi:ornithine--oxo-acid transaminase
MNNTIALEERYCAHNYAPLPVVLVKGEGVFVWDDQDKRYLDMMSAYSAVSHGHCHPRLVEVMTEQAQRLAVVSRAFYSQRLAPFLQRLCEMTGQDMALPMNTGAEAVETALKAARKWAYTVKGVAPDRAEVIVCENNFHGRTIAIVGMSSEAQYREGFGPFPAGFKIIPYGDAEALAAAITPNTAAFLLEPIQGEGGIVIPPPGFLAECARLCKERNVLLLCDEIQSGLGRTGRLLASDHEAVKPDGLILGKALGGGLLPVSAFLARREVMAVFHPGDHGSTFGGNPLAAAVALEALNIIERDRLAERAQELGDYFLARLKEVASPLMAEGILSKETHETVIRFAPPLVVNREQLDWALARIDHVFAALQGG